MPDLIGMGRLWKAWHDIGRTSGIESLPWTEVESFGRIAGLDAQDIITVQHMSVAYLDGLALVHPLAIMPMEIDAEDRADCVVRHDGEKAFVIRID